jgi:hypothetical protein
MKKPAQVYAEIRREHPNQPFGDHWAGIGHYCGEDVWADPEYVGMPGEYEFEYEGEAR